MTSSMYRPALPAVTAFELVFNWLLSDVVSVLMNGVELKISKIFIYFGNKAFLSFYKFWVLLRR